MGKYKFRLPDGEVTTVEADSFVTGLMRVCDQVGIRPVSAIETGEKSPKVKKLINRKTKEKLKCD